MVGEGVIRKIMSKNTPHGRVITEKKKKAEKHSIREM